MNLTNNLFKLKKMKKLNKVTKLVVIVGVFTLMAFSSACTLVGLDFQKNADFNPHVLDPHVDKTAWQLIKERSIQNQPDSIYNLMYQAIVYSGIDTTEYTKPGRTFILLHNDAIYRLSKNKITNDCYWGKYLVNGKPATKWQDYPKEQVKNYLLYLIVKGEYSFNNLGPDNTNATTLEPLGADPKNPNSIMALRVNDDANYKMRLNDFPNSLGYVQVRTSNILSTTGPVQVIDRVLFYEEQ